MVALLKRSVPETAAGLGSDERAYQCLMSSLVAHSDQLAGELLGPMLHWPRHPFLLASFARRAFRSASAVARAWFKAEPARALFAGLAAHSFLALDQIPSSAFAIVLGLFGHAFGWPMPRGGAAAVSRDMRASRCRLTDRA